jgi:uncharacterized protein (DUF1015 family)
MASVATVQPFRGVTYDPARVPDLGDVTCPPYDVISEAERDRLYDRHPYNFVRITSGREEADDGGDQNKYTRACGFFRSWLWEGMLIEDAEPALFVYRQAFDDPTGHLRRVWGLLATIGLDDEILAHEKTMPGPKADRLALMETIPANLSPIYAIYKEEGGGVSADLSSFAHGAPVADFTDEEATRHTVWAVHDPAFHEKVSGALGGSPLLIADGHHRFETAKAYRDLRRSADGPGTWDSIMCLLVDAGEQPLCILPYHRIVRHADAATPMEVASSGFFVEDLGEAADDAVNAFSQELWDRMDTFGMIFDGHLYRLVPKQKDIDDIPAGILAKLALQPMGIRSAEEGLSFSPHAKVVRDETLAGRAVCGFLIPPVEVQRVWDLAAGGGKMPEKSTYFHPKPRDGIVVRALEPCATP